MSEPHGRRPTAPPNVHRSRRLPRRPASISRVTPAGFQKVPLYFIVTYGSSLVAILETSLRSVAANLVSEKLFKRVDSIPHRCLVLSSSDAILGSSSHDIQVVDQRDTHKQPRGFKKKRLPFSKGNIYQQKRFPLGILPDSVAPLVASKMRAGKTTKQRAEGFGAPCSGS